MFLVVSLGAQDNPYAAQQSAVEQLLASQKYRQARAQAAGILEASAQAQLPEVEARFAYLLGQAYLTDPSSDARGRVEGIRALQRSARLYGKLGDKENLKLILAQLGELQGKTISLDDLEDKRSKRKKRLRPVSELDSLTVESVALSALVNSQTETIEALNDSQMMAMLKLQQQQRLFDSLEMHALEDSLLVVQQEMLLNVQSSELETQRQTRNFLYLLGAAILAILGVVYWRFLASRRYQRTLEEKNQQILDEQERSDKLLLNVLPAKVAAELKDKGKARAQRHENVSVLFADFKGFSALAQTLEPAQLVSMLDEAFQAFDRILRNYELEKIKTIGDAYMCAGGLPNDQKDHAELCVKAAMDMQDYLATHPNFSARIGIHSGPVVAGVVGLDKFAYDIWGDTVNRAARLEVAGEINQINISEATKQLLDPHQYAFQDRGLLPIKNLGELRMYFVSKK